MSWGAVAGAAIGVFGGALLNKGSGDTGAGSSRAQNMLADISAEEWQMYKEQAVPLLKSLSGNLTPTTVEQEQALASAARGA